jgi:hypothetical protein
MKKRNFLIYTIVAIVFWLLLHFNYFDGFFVTRGEFLAAAAKVPSIKNYGGDSPLTTVKVFGSYGWAIVLGFSLISWLVSLILLLILKIVRLAKFKIANLIVLLLTYGAVLGLACELLFYEKRYAVASLGIIFFVGGPLYSASICTLVFIALIFIIPMLIGLYKKKKTPPTNTTPTAKAEVKGIPSEPAKPETPSEPKPNPMAKFAVLLVLPLLAAGCNLIGDSFAKYGNLIANPECDGSNPLCLKKDIFWKAMKKSYKYQNQSS